MAPAPPQSQTEITIRVCSEIVRRLLDAHDNGEDVNLNALKASVARKHGSKMVPRLVDIISAVPHEVKDILLPKLRAKPVRTASGVCSLSLRALSRAELTPPGEQIAVVAVMSKPHRCPHIAMTGNICVCVCAFSANCLSCLQKLTFPDTSLAHRYCPGGPDSDFEYSTQSYTVRLLSCDATTGIIHRY